MNSEFNSVEAELREIEDEFTSGRMNAFGNSATKDGFLRKLRQISDVETEVFYRACSLLNTSASEDYVLQSMLFTNTEQSAGGNGSNTNNSDAEVSWAGATTRFSQTWREMGKGATFNERASFTGTLGGERFPRFADGREGNKASQESQLPYNTDAGFSDRPFEDISRHFKLLEGEFTALGDHLRQISVHVFQLNDMTDRARASGDEKPI